MAGAVEEGAKAIGGVIDVMRAQPLALMLGLMNIALLVFLFFYLSRITSRTENTVQALFTSNDKLYAQWGTIVKDTNDLTEKALHCILPDDALKLLQVRPGPYAPAEPQRPLAPEKPSLSLPPISPHAEKSMLFLPPAPPLTDPTPAADPAQ
jgi:hypothetical protein